MPGQIVGKVAVKVVPDTRNFRDDLRDKLRRIEKSLPKLKIRATFNETGLKSEVLKAIRDLNREMRANDLYKIKLTAKVDLDKNALRATSKRLEDWREDHDPLKVSVVPDMMAGRSAAISARLALLTRPRTVKITPILTPGAMKAVGAGIAALAGGRVLWDVLDGVWDRLRELDRSVPIIGTVAEAIAGLSAWSMAAASNLFALSQSLAQIGGLGLALPGVLGGIAIGLGATVAVLKDFNDVLPEVAKRLSRLQDQMSSRFWSVAEQPIRDMIDSLLPKFSRSIRQTSTELGRFFGSLASDLDRVLGPILGSMFNDLNRSILIAAHNTDAFAGIIAKLGRLGAGELPALAGWVGKIARQFDDWLTRAERSGELQRFVDNGKKQLSELGRALGNLGGIFNGLADIFEAAGGSTLTIFADTLQAVEDIVKSPGFRSGMVDVFEAAHAAMSKIADISGPAFTDLMSSLSKTVPKVFDSMAETIGTALDAIFDALNQPEVMDGLVALFEGIEEGVKALAPAMAPIGKALGGLMQLVGELAAQLGPVLAEAFIALAPVVEEVALALVPLVEELGPVLVQLIKELAPLMPPLVEAFIAFTEALIPLLPDLTELAVTILPPLVAVLTGLLDLASMGLPHFVQFIQGVINSVTTLVESCQGIARSIEMLFNGDIYGSLTKFWSSVKGLFGGAVKLLMTYMTYLFGGLEPLVTPVLQALQRGISRFWGAITGFFSRGITSITTTWSRGWAAIQSVGSNALARILGVVQRTLNLIVAVFTGDWGRVKEIVRTAASNIVQLMGAGMTRLVQAVQQGADRVLGILRALPGQIIGIFGGASGWLFAAGASIIGGLVSGISSRINEVRSKLSQLTGMIPKWKGPEKKDRKLLYKAGQLIIQGLNKGLESRFGQVQRNLRRLTSLIPKDASKAFKRTIAEMRGDMLGALSQWAAFKKRINETAFGSANKVLDMGKLTDLQTESFDGIVANLKEAVKRATEWRKTLKQLSKQGLNAKAFEQLALSGPDSLDLATAIAESGKKGIKEINKLHQKLANAAKGTQHVVRDSMMDNGAQMAKGLLKGLRDHRRDLEKEIGHLADSLVRTIRKRLDIHSPSRVFEEIGKNVSRGLAKGIASVEVQPPTISGVSDKIAAQVSSAASAGSTTSKTFHYHAAPGNSLGSEEDLFRAAQRGRMVSW